MEKIRKNFGFGCMRLPMIGEDVDMEQTKQMVDCFLEQGFSSLRASLQPAAWTTLTFI